MIILSQNRALPIVSHIASRRTVSRRTSPHRSRSYYRPFIAYHHVSIADPSYQTITASQIPTASHITAYRQRADTRVDRIAYPRRIMRHVPRSVIRYAITGPAGRMAALSSRRETLRPDRMRR